MKPEKFTINQFHASYPDDDACIEQIFINRYGNLKECPECHKPFSYYKVTDRKCYSCAFCAHQIHPLADTIFHKSSTSLKNWFFAIFLFSTSRNGVSAKELERHLGVTYKCAWRIAKQIRKLFDENINPLSNIVEIDETYIGGKEKNKHQSKKTENAQGRSLKTKTPIMGAVERKGKLVAKVVIDTKSSTVGPFLRDYVSIDAGVKTDEYLSYNGLEEMGYNHNRINHSQKVYVDGDTHTNTIEGFWSLLKRSVDGTYHFVSPKYLQEYANEFSFRYNRRYSKAPMFNELISKVERLS